MTEQTPPPGWYPDDSGQQRYWDGSAWTDHVAEPQAGAVVPGAPAAAGGRWAPTEYLEGAGSDFGGAISNAISNIVQWEGRASRSSFWWFALALWIASFIASLIAGQIGGNALSYVVSVLVFLIGLSLSIRRLHDTGRSGWWNLLYLVPCVGFIVLIVFWVMDSTPGPNQYNIDPTGGPQAA